MMKEVKILEDVTVRFAGDSGDGMQLTGSQFTNTTALFGNDVSTLPDYPAEIRAPAGSLYGVSGFQLHFGSTDIRTPGDSPDVLIAMNPAALKVNLCDLKPDSTIIVNTSAFDLKNLRLAKYENNPLEDGSLKGFNVIQVPLSQLTATALAESSLSMKEVARSKNFFALGLMYWLYSRPFEPTVLWLENKFKSSPKLLEGNKKALLAGYYYGENTEIFTTRYNVAPAQLEKGFYRSVSGNEAVALGLTAAAVKSKLQLFLGSYPITPATEILQELSKYKTLGVKTFQAEDEICAMAATIGAAFAGHLAATSTSGPGLSLKSEAIGLAVMTELPCVIVDVQRGGPSTGLPTKTEQADLLQAMYARNGEAPVVVLAAATPADCFEMSFEAARIALKYMTPVILLTDGYLANGSEPWKIPDPDSLPDISVPFRTEKEGFYPYLRDENLSRPWAIPGTPGLEHRVGGLEKSNIYGDVSYDTDNHELMVKLRTEKIAKVVNDVPALEVTGDADADILVVGWGGTYGSINEAVSRVRKNGHKVAQAHFRYINPFPYNTAEVLKKYKTILVPELNLGQLASMLRSAFLVEVIQHNKVKGLPFKASEVEEKILAILGGKDA